MRYYKGGWRNRKVEAAVATPTLIGILAFSAIIMFVIFVLAVNSWLDATSVSVKNFSFDEATNSITLELKLRNTEGMHYKVKYEGEKVLISPHSVSQEMPELSETITLQLQENSTIICYEETLSTDKPFLLKDGNTNEWKKANFFDKIKFTLENMFALT